MKSPTNIFVITGPTAAGEDSVIEGLEKLFPVKRFITTVSRPMRNDESQGNPYYFITREEFEQKISRDEMVEYAVGSNNYYYGITREEFERYANTNSIVLWKVDVKGARYIKTLFPDIQIIHIAVESYDVIRKRLTSRDPNATEQYIEERLAYAKEWFEETEAFDHTVVNKEGKLEETVEEVAEIVRENWKK